MMQWFTLEKPAVRRREVAHVHVGGKAAIEVERIMFFYTSAATRYEQNSRSKGLAHTSFVERPRYFQKEWLSFLDTIEYVDYEAHRKRHLTYPARTE